MRLFCIFFVILALSVTPGLSKEEKPVMQKKGAEKKIVGKNTMGADLVEWQGVETKGKIAVITTKYGEIHIKFYSDKSPNTAANFVQLIESGYYTGLNFHRIVPGFVAQGGCPEGTGRGGPGYNIKFEKNDLKHSDGAVAMARSTDRDSAGSQFYICLGPQHSLDANYVVFGQVIKGNDIPKKIQKGDKIEKAAIAPAK